MVRYLLWSPARARRFYEPSRFGRTVSTISIAAKIVAGIETRSEGRDGATGGFACPGTAPPSRARTGLGRAASVAHALPAPSLPHALLAITPRMRAREDGRRHAEQPRIGAGVRGNTEWPVRGHLRDPPVPEIQEDCYPLRQISRPRSPSCQRTSAHLSPPNSRSAASQPDMTSCSQTSWASSNSPLSPSGSNS
jgi:hypothetical protein